MPGVGGLTDPGRDLRRRAVQTIAAALEPAPKRLQLLAPGPTLTRWDANSSDPYPIERLVGRRRRRDGPARPDHVGGAPVSLAVAVGSSLVMAAGWAGPVGVSAPSDDLDQLGDDGDVVIMVGDGSALRRDGGPDLPRAEAIDFDDQLLAAITAGDPARLDALCEAYRPLAAELMITGLPVWRELAARATPPVEAFVDYAGDPFGVFSVIASWRW